MDPTYNNKPDLEKASYYFPTDIKSPFKAGVIELRQGVNNLKQGNIAGISQVALGILNLIPGINYTIYTIRHKLSTRTPQTIVAERKNQLTQEVNSTGVRLQQVYFETHNSKLRGGLSFDSPIRNLLDCSYPDRQLAILIRDLEHFKATCSNDEKMEIDQQLKILKEMEPLSLLTTTYLLARNDKERMAIWKEAKSLLKEQIQSLKENEVKIVPFGYTDADVYDVLKARSPGHIALVEVSKQQGKTVLRVFNSGEGLQSHDSNAEGKNFPLKLGNLDVVNLEEKVLDHLVDNILGSQLKNFMEVYKYIKEAKGSSADETPQKAYRGQDKVNNCPKKSLQIWLHDRLRDNPELYQKFRIFSVERQQVQLDEILNNNKGKKLKVEHSVALWGGSDRVEETVHNIYFKLKGFFFGPQVKLNAERSEILEMKEYCEKVKLSRMARLELLRDDPQKAIEILRAIPIYEREDVMNGLKSFCNKLGLTSAEALNNQTRGLIYKKGEIQEFIKNVEKEAVALELEGRGNEALRTLNIDGKFLLRINEDEEALRLWVKMDEIVGVENSLKLQITEDFHQELLISLIKKNPDNPVIDQLIDSRIKLLDADSVAITKFSLFILPFRKEAALSYLDAEISKYVVNNDLQNLCYILVNWPTNLTSEAKGCIHAISTVTKNVRPTEALTACTLLFNPRLKLDEKKELIIGMIQYFMDNQDPHSFQAGGDLHQLKKIFDLDSNTGLSLADFFSTAIDADPKYGFEDRLVFLDKMKNVNPEYAQKIYLKAWTEALKSNIFNLEMFMRRAKEFKIIDPELFTNRVIEQMNSHLDEGKYLEKVTNILFFLAAHDLASANRLKAAIANYPYKQPHTKQFAVEELLKFEKMVGENK